jgi:hypothetical protein
LILSRATNSTRYSIIYSALPRLYNNKGKIISQLGSG